MPKSMSDKELEKYVDKLLSIAEKEIINDAYKRFQDKFVKLLSNSVDAFYDNYKKPPRKYERTDMFREGAKVGYEMQFDNKTVTVEWRPEAVPDHPGWGVTNPIPYSGERIWNDAFIEGIHGMESVKVMDEPPINLMRKDFQNIIDEATNEAVANWTPKI